MTKLHSLPIAMAVTLLAGCTGQGPTGHPAMPPTSSLFLDVHELGPDNVTAEAVAEAHQKDLREQGEHGVRFLQYWVDEDEGKIYCLSRATCAKDVVETHREAHGLLPDEILEVTDGEEAPAFGGRQLFLDVHRLGPGNVTAAAVAEAHQKDLAEQGEHGVRFLQYWVDETQGTVVCLSEAADAADITATHAAAHGLLPDEILPVSEGS